jgi:uncharacterized protein (TIGR03086 family)
MTIVKLLERGYQDTARMLASIPADGWDAPSRCAEWTVRQAGNHLVGSLHLLSRVAEGETVDPAEFDPQMLADSDSLGSDAPAAFRSAAERSVAVFTLPDTLDQKFVLPAGPAPGIAVANISLMEALVHGWDIARGAGVAYPTDGAVVAAVNEFAQQAIGEPQRENGFIGPVVSVGAQAGVFDKLLGHLGRCP